MKQTYIRCPRCELNFILKKDKFCNVCKKEMKALGSMANDEDLDLELCPVCKVNYISPNEDMCAVCAKEKALAEEDDEKDVTTNWESYTTPEDDEAGYSDEETSDMVSISNLGDDSLEVDDDMPLTLEDEDEDEEDIDDEEKKKDDIDIDDEDLDDFENIDDDEEDDDYVDENDD
ncbi:MAG: hypothetical protein EOM55_00385 [Clostridia bacterium]|nr:hypothetical protein [Clostridia bacterium]